MTTPQTAASRRSTVVVRPARPDESAHVAWLAALTFPLACPPGTPVATMASHVAAHLTPAAFADWTASDRHALLVAVDPGATDRPIEVRQPDLLGYTLVSFGSPDGAEERDVLLAAAGPGPYAELSKIYVHPQALGAGVAARLMAGAVDAVAGLAGPGTVAPLWLGTNGQNERAQAFYRKHGFEVAGTRTYDVGGVRHDDVIMLHRPA
ncbi:GNAT family N-acetyltransferase [Krasilnikoviella flava]|uniref:Ribosomal protein S18 acetylase RimI n=1 Tax=Krasilnikoviella flava TaxID=526729 RepID=A0A1T5I694_9MICO|nr:GNAT family N-acetyltransferase [Krasilnikoviella flava]SKC34721.1 Ribosomal protein S18 acetylase RimI [Krasilnikoviella flava]